MFLCLLKCKVAHKKQKAQQEATQVVLTLHCIFTIQCYLCLVNKKSFFLKNANSLISLDLF